MERLVVPGRIDLNDAIRHAEFNKAVKERMLTEPAFANNARRSTFLSNYVQDLGATITLLRTIQNPSAYTAEDIAEIIIQRPEVFACVNQFTTGQVLHHHELVKNITAVSFRRTYPEADQ